MQSTGNDENESVSSEQWFNHFSKVQIEKTNKMLFTLSVNQFTFSSSSSLDQRDVCIVMPHISSVCFVRNRSRGISLALDYIHGNYKQICEIYILFKYIYFSKRPNNVASSVNIGFQFVHSKQYVPNLSVLTVDSENSKSCKPFLKPQNSGNAVLFHFEQVLLFIIHNCVIIR